MGRIPEKIPRGTTKAEGVDCRTEANREKEGNTHFALWCKGSRTQRSGSTGRRLENKIALRLDANRQLRNLLPPGMALQIGCFSARGVRLTFSFEFCAGSVGRDSYEHPGSG